MRRFKDFKKTTTSSMSQEEIDKYLNTVGNTGADHSHQDWDNQDGISSNEANRSSGESVCDRSEIEKKHTIERDVARGRKIFEKEAHRDEDPESEK